MEFSSYAVDQWPPYWSQIRKGISGLAQFVLDVFLCNPMPTHHNFEVCEAVYASQRFACERERCIQGGVDTHHFRFRRIYFQPPTARSLPYLIGLISNLSLSACQDRQIIGLVKVIQIFHATRRNSSRYPT